MTTKPLVSHIKRHAGVAGQYAYSARVKYAGEKPETITFVGTEYGHNVVMCYGDGLQVQVFDPERFGPKLDTDWVRRFWDWTPNE